MKAPEGNTNGAVPEQDTIDAGHEESEYLLETKSLTNVQASGVPRDRYNICYMVFLIMGLCSVLPWNMFITAVTYFDYKFKNTTVNGTDLRPMFEGYFSVAAMVPNILAQLLNLALQHKISLRVRVIGPLFGMLLFFILTTILTRVDTDEWQILFFVITMGSVIFINACGAVYQGSVFGVAGTLPKRYMQAIMAGQGMGGILPSLLSIASVAGTKNAADSGFIYFLCAVLCILLTACAFLSLPKIKYSAYYLNQHAELTQSDKLCTLESTDGPRKAERHTKPPFMEIFYKIKVPAIMVLIVFAVTIGLFPGTLAIIQPIDKTNRIWANDYFSLVTCFLVFNTLDFTGRSLAVIQWPKASHMPFISALVLLRLVFFPLFAFCNIQGNPLYLVFNNDAYFIIFNALFAFSNGFLGSLLMIYGPKFVDAKHSETAGVMMALFLSAGLAVGAVISVLFLTLF